MNLALVLPPPMESFLKNLVWETVQQLALLLLLLSPVILAAWRVFHTRARHRRMAVEPFTSPPLRPPGESLRLKLEVLDEKLSDEILLLIGLPGFIATVLMMNKLRLPPLFLLTVLLLIAGFTLWRFRKLRSLMHELWNRRLGFDGERVVGEALNQLMLDGYRVFHDLPCDGFNIDHVIVGPAGVFAVETKTKRKPTDGQGKKLAWEVTYDGMQLTFPHLGRDDRWIEQAARNARHLGKWLTAAVGEPVTAQPILVIPGWLIQRQARGAVNVLNEKEVRSSMPRPVQPLAADLVKRITHQLAEKCRLIAPVSAA